jgi:hypothetical protein
MFRAQRSTHAAAVTAAGACAIAACVYTASPAAAPAVQTPPLPGVTAPKTPDGQTRVNPQAALAAEFLKRVEEYVKLHRKIEDSLPKLSKEATPEEIDKYQRELARLIVQARGKAKTGDIFTQPIRAYLRRQIAAAFAGPEGSKLKASIMDENVGPIKIHVNGRYPDTVPLATMPPQVLAELPRLPEELEYRFIGQRLILLDVHAHIIVDLIEDALPN